MTPTIKIDDREWKQAARELFRTSSRSCVDFTNGQALKVAIEAVRRTEKTPAEKIQVTPEFAKAMIGMRLRRDGTKGWVKGTLQERIKKLIAARKRSRAFIASGWIPARNKLFTIVREKPPGTYRSVAGAKTYGKPKGAAKPASFSLRSKIESLIENTALLDASKYPSKPRNPMPVAIKGLQEAINEAARDMIETLARRLNKDLKKYNAGTTTKR